MLGISPDAVIFTPALAILSACSKSCSSFLYELPTPYDKSIIEFIDANKYIVRSDVDKLLNVSQATSNRILKRLVENGTLYQVGNGKNTKYIKK